MLKLLYPYATQWPMATAHALAYRPLCSISRRMHNIVPVPLKGTKQRQRIVQHQNIWVYTQTDTGIANQKRRPDISKFESWAEISGIETKTNLTEPYDIDQRNLALGRSYFLRFRLEQRTVILSESTKGNMVSPTLDPVAARILDIFNSPVPRMSNPSPFQWSTFLSHHTNIVSRTGETKQETDPLKPSQSHHLFFQPPTAVPRLHCNRTSHTNAPLKNHLHRHKTTKRRKPS